MALSSTRLLVAASGTGGHLFPAIATAEQLSDYQIEWLGVPDRLETQLVPQKYLLHTIRVGGFQGRLGLGSVRLMTQLMRAVFQVRQILQQGKFQGVFTTGGYISAPAIIAARSLGLPTILHESNALPGKVTRWLSPWCTTVALGFDTASSLLPRTDSICVGTPVRSQFLQAASDLQELAIPQEAPLVVVMGGSQGAVAVNQLVRQAAPAWLDAGAWLVHLTGDNDPEVDQLSHPHYIHRPFYDNMAALLQRADFAISRAGAGTLTELAVTRTPAILIPYPFAAEDHQTYNAAVFAAAGAALVSRQSDLTVTDLRDRVLTLLNDRERLAQMAQAAGDLAITDSAERLAKLVREVVQIHSTKSN
ncbi:undecaprenyldiphospho-muramoylpentapeptide beta-N-acetylglucosaminyltransferase [Almyronema epifaneia]|uniref:UDP-N-acetylglucosamine--N-acetylmuramyl-(pentapeptide) pyrophosphoryl-undecaprenol N-acetylglucosamine transferase n=1 Tax=Almyronema epifaneia S1 TaxID=2991925 RepID=A0ABW6IIM8_9CYAN